MLQPILWLILAAIHALPALAFFRPAGLSQLYGIAADNPLFLLMHHRAALLLAVFAACVYAAFVPEGRRLAVIVVGISMVSFLALYWMAGSPAALRRIALVDLAGLPVLLAVAWMAYRG
ncbi:hypothetical protein P7228_11065 [Altererythrobacter arenosus]|uniref:Phosphopantetheine adenylyltransferase n=1 Tax=Altererythrobacter arenosus TaxID=3032592 RepID=A0ABY8FWY4_9SPHN|nr:hypothetical protein [Altererythrobacter sp. CAU 1644]WFL76534.1 hypothetical protein P7228_11065 [Altererythrobacter sp. CAU 1644]